ncbi:MAG: RpiB/LacA/LacB family sugar-phosphate isomerase, partial [Coriobacteriia bacterium]|nr:RpiB/LacA/LacB family sugar-phosphate isomerase [Coriobacteriia bacterium]
MRIGIASDHAGFEQKEILKPYLESKGFEVLDLGPDSDDRVDYPDFAEALATKVADGSLERGVLICGTGIGMAMSAGKIRGIRIASITSPQFAELSRQHNDANMIALSGRFVDPQTNRDILDA